MSMPSQYYTRYWDKEEANERLLIGYATGALDEALALMAASYAELNEQARQTLYEMQAMCGALLEEIAPIAVSNACREKLLACLDEATNDEAKEECLECHGLPLSLQRYTGGTCFEDLNWHHKRRGVDVAKVQGVPASVLRVQPGLQPAKPIYNTVRFTLVLDGALNKDGQMLERGSLHITTPDSREPVSTCGEKGCVVFSTQENFCHTARLLCRLLGLG